MKKENRTEAALREIYDMMPSHNDLESYIVGLCMWGLGMRKDKPNPADYNLVDISEDIE